MSDVKEYTEDKIDINEIANKIKQEYAAQNSAQTAKMPKQATQTATATATAPAPAPAATATAQAQAAPQEAGEADLESEEDYDNAIDVDIDNIEFEVESDSMVDDEYEYYAQPHADTYEEAGSYDDYNYGRPSRAYRAINKHAYTWLFSFVLGMYGGDRFIRGQVGLGILKMMTFGGFGFWYLADLAMAMYKSYGGAFSDSEEVLFDRFGNFIN